MRIRKPAHQASRLKSVLATSLESHSSQQDELQLALERIQGLETEVAHVIRGMEEKVRQMECLTAFSAMLNSTLDPELVREKSLEATCKLLVCESASLFLVDTKSGELYCETSLGNVDQSQKKSLRLPIDDRSIAGYVAMTGESVILNDVAKDPRSASFLRSVGSFCPLTMICAPLRSKDKIIGVLQALNKLPAIPPRSSQHSWPDFYESDLRLLETLGHQVAIAVENSRLYTDLKRSFYGTVEALAETIEKKDHYTGGHTQRVVRYSLCIANYLPLTPEELERIRLAGLLHDIGKIGIEDRILKKQTGLEEHERRTMQEHPKLGYDIMSRVEGLRDVMGGMRYHHERWDGKGYPSGLRGEEIPLIARIIAVADAYDAMVSTRPYRKGVKFEKAFDEIVRNQGTQFDPVIVEAFVQAFKEPKSMLKTVE